MANTGREPARDVVGVAAPRPAADHAVRRGDRLAAGRSGGGGCPGRVRRPGRAGAAATPCGGGGGPGAPGAVGPTVRPGRRSAGRAAGDGGGRGVGSRPPVHGGHRWARRATPERRAPRGS
ncbi:hypothetical protein C1I95_24490 [Micromonospora craterilacus]|uniref:Uncharacterized protein n=1 Tax=Micromonospora craterilacus TaxID=1655439 RepID=A0A2W2EUL5_9ACTN|nr:hypothetical protein C1I95_24490 [Micromonospora craterilacus]